MESSHTHNTLIRLVLLKNWLFNTCKLENFDLTPLIPDASFRRYYRVNLANHISYVAMDAPKPTENCHAFVAIAKTLRAHGLLAPEIIAENKEQGFLLLTDFGDLTLLNVLKKTPTPHLYKLALQALAKFQAIKEIPHWTLAHFDSDWINQEWQWHQSWFLKDYLSLKVSNEVNNCYQQLITSAINQPQVLMYRDFHAGNLMVLDDNQIGLLDFQDAFIGPLTYDVVSLLRDCYIDWPENLVREYALYYKSLLDQLGVTTHLNEAAFLQYFDWMGIQRHLKALMTFARKYLRDQQPTYLQYIPRTLNYIITVSAKYSALEPLHSFYNTEVFLALKRRIAICAP